MVGMRDQTGEITTVATKVSPGAPCIANGLRGISRAKGPRTTVPGRGLGTRLDLLDRGSKAPAPNRVWVADITYCRTFAGWV